MPNKLRKSLAVFTAFARFLIGGFLHGAPSASSADLQRTAFLNGIALLETGTIDVGRPCAKIGRRGERSAWQISPEVWREYCEAPFTRASSDGRLAAMVAAAHLEWLRLSLEGKGRPATPYNLALAWNAGLGAVLTGKAPPGAHDYAARAVALYEALTSAKAQ
jgi:hypothetical protein